MSSTGNPGLPPPQLLEALRRPRGPQLRDAPVQQILKRWKKRGRPIKYGDLNDVAAIVSPGREPDANTRARIVAAVEAAGIEIGNFDSFRQWIADNNVHVSLTGDAMFELAEEARWRRPHEWDARPPPPEPPEWLKEALQQRLHCPPPPQPTRTEFQM